MDDWFEKLFGFFESSPDAVRENIELKENFLHSKVNGRSFNIGRLLTPSLGQLRSSVKKHSTQSKGKLKVQNIIGNVREFHCDLINANSLFQVASQFNLLEMVDPDVTPERGVTIYELDQTQGPACAIAAGAATVYRNYFTDVNGKIGQTFDNQIDCLSEVGNILGNIDESLWSMKNGYAMCSIKGLSKVNEKLESMDEQEKDRIRESLHIGLHLGVEVTEKNAPEGQLISQAFCSALPVAYSDIPSELWKNFAKLILESSYEATLCAAIANKDISGSNKLFLTLLGGGAFGNDPSWICDAMVSAFKKYKE